MTKKQKACYDKVRAARRKGLLVQAKRCDRCHYKPGLGTDGRSLLHAHHADYDKPLSVEWLCPPCHRKETRLPLGERNGNAKLRRSLVKAAILLCREGFAIVDIATFYGMSRQGLSHAVGGRTWKRLAERAK